MRARIVKIGNSKGIRIPKPLLEQTGIHEHVELELGKNKIVIRPVAHPRAGWEDEFRAMAENEDDLLISGKGGISHSWDEKEWRW